MILKTCHILLVAFDPSSNLVSILIVNEQSVVLTSKFDSLDTPLSPKEDLMVWPSYSADGSKLAMSTSFACLYLLANDGALLGLWAHSVACARAGLTQVRFLRDGKLVCFLATTNCMQFCRI